MMDIINIVDGEDMKIRIEVDERIEENEVVVKCNELNDEIKNIQKVLAEIASQSKQIIFYKGSTEYYISLDNILFFETEDSGISAHTINDVYVVKYKLYELEDILPMNFLRVSKSTILNTNHIYSITRNITSASVVEFQNTHKKVFVSRHYYKVLQFKLLEKRR